MATRMPSVHAAVLTAVALGLVTSLAAQTAVKPPKNRYTPQQDVKLGTRSRRRGAQAVSRSSRTRGSRATSRLGRSAGGQRPARAEPAGLRVFVHAGEPEGDQRVRAARRADVRQPRHVRCGGVRGRGGRRDGARAVARAAPARHRQRVEGAEPVAAARPDRRRRRRRGGRRRGGIRHRAGQPVRPRHAAVALQPRLREAGGSARRADHGARRLRPARAGAHVRDDREGVEEQRRRRRHSG